MHAGQRRASAGRSRNRLVQPCESNLTPADIATVTTTRPGITRDLRALRSAIAAVDAATPPDRARASRSLGDPAGRFGDKVAFALHQIGEYGLDPRQVLAGGLRFTDEAYEHARRDQPRWRLRGCHDTALLLTLAAAGLTPEELPEGDALPDLDGLRTLAALRGSHP